MSSHCSTAESAQSALRPAAPGLDRRPLVALALGFVMAALDVTVVNVALPRIQADLSVSLSGLVWVVDGYTLTFAALLLVGGALANRYGARRAYMGGLAVFVIASLLCGLAPGGAVLVAARLLQGVGAALFMPSSLSLVVQTYPDDTQRTRMMALWLAMVSLAMVMGPVVGGLLVSTIGWRSIFWLNLPVGLAGLALTRRDIAPSPRRRQALNPASHVLGVVALAALAFALVEGAALGWLSAPIVGAMVLALVAVVLFVRRERRHAAPIVPRELLRDATFPAANAVGFLINLAAYGQIFLISLFLPQVRGTDPWHTGLALLPLMAVIPFGNLLSGRISAHWGARSAMTWGLIIAAAVSAVLIITSADMPYALFAAAIALSNFGIGVAIPAMSIVLMQAAGQAHANSAAAALNANRQIGTLVGVAAMGAVLHTAPDWARALPLAYVLIAGAYVAAALIVRRRIRPA